MKPGFIVFLIVLIPTLVLLFTVFGVFITQDLHYCKPIDGPCIRCTRQKAKMDKLKREDTNVYY